MLSRIQLISQYKIEDKGLDALLDALFTKSDDANNKAIIKNALRGDYSDFGSKHDMPQHMLIRHFQIAGYDDLITRVEQGDFDHDYAPKPSVNHQNPKAAYANRARQEHSMQSLFKVLSENPDITMGELDKRVREEESTFSFK